MSTYEQEHEQALLDSPWLPLPTTPPVILKHTPHPSRPGYIVLLTDLSSVYLEVLTAPSVPSRLNQVQRHFHTERETEDDIISKSEKALKDVKGLWGQELRMELSSHDYHDAILTAQSDDFDWLFYLTEIKGRQAADILAKQLIGPLASMLLDNVKGTPIDLVHTLFSSPIAQHMTKHAKEEKEPSEQEYASDEARPKFKSQSASPPPSSDRRHIEDTPSPAKRQAREDTTPSLPGPSQTRREREKAEEEEMTARAEAMKRKMEGGGGGGSLARRRLRR